MPRFSLSSRPPFHPRAAEPSLKTADFRCLILDEALSLRAEKALSRRLRQEAAAGAGGDTARGIKDEEEGEDAARIASRKAPHAASLAAPPHGGATRGISGGGITSAAATHIRSGTTTAGGPTAAIFSSAASGSAAQPATAFSALAVGAMRLGGVGATSLPTAPLTAADARVASRITKASPVRGGVKTSPG